MRLRGRDTLYGAVPFKDFRADLKAWLSRFPGSPFVLFYFPTPDGPDNILEVSRKQATRIIFASVKRGPPIIRRREDCPHCGVPSVWT
jgi:hypothetical protein